MVSSRYKFDLLHGRRSGLMVSALVSGTSGPGAVLLGKTLYSHSAPLQPGV